MKSNTIHDELGEELSRIKDQIIREFEPEKIILFGSLAKKGVSLTSDIDLLIVKDTTLSFKERMNILYSTIDYRYPTDMLFYTPEEIDRMRKFNPLIKNVLKEGVCVYEK